MEERKLPVGIQSFEEIRNGNYLYIDKTEYIWKLIQSGKVYFLSRPRRFGKSLLTSTLEAYFQGRKELFEGLYIGEKEKEWDTYPILHFDLSTGDYRTENGLAKKLGRILAKYERQYNFTPYDDDLTGRFEDLIEHIREATGRQSVVLIDEYDTPLLDPVDLPDILEKNRWTLRPFFRVLKSEDANLKFVFVSGITRFAKVSIFSDMNHLNDISIDDAYASICGITEDELLRNFQPEIRHLSHAKGQSEEECIIELKRMYDGYHFSKNGEGVYNPFSLLNSFSKNDYGRYWFGTGTPGFLISLMKNNQISVAELSEGIRTNEDKLMDYGGDNKDAASVFYQAGYLTIEKYDPETKLYSLEFPNEEVKYGFLNALVPMFLGESNENTVSLTEMSEDLKKGDIAAFMDRLEALLARLPYSESKASEYEEFWKDRVVLVFLLLGEKVKSEVHTSNGRSDCVVETKDYAYIFEFKIDETAEEALQQIDEKEYALPYKADPRKLYKIGVNFSSKKKNVENYRMAQDAE